ncbi:MAG: glycosyl transferase family 51 [Deltaproteobacteria bacterium]|nr:MAG: glycosyl transferase family 51 [Deltaproteobacteria bacterium]
MLKKIFLTLFFLSFIVLGCGGIWLYRAIVVEPGSELSPEYIEKILGRESQVYYSDGVTKLGVFFDTAHRQYVRYSEIPSDFINALVAAEDKRYFEHFGFDLLGILRAMVANFRAGRVVQGGSTLTQQTAKNLFKRKERSYQEKLKELLLALRLEYHYSKEKILEFYANQFYVSGIGHGLGVAARYYFDKKPSQLTLAECAFIAGSVKRPSAYNPFIQKTPEGVEKAKARGRIRLRYVLGKMRETGRIDTRAYNKALAGGLSFRHGRVGFSLDYPMELVREAVSSPALQAALYAKNIDNIATAGVRVITTVDKALQEKTLAALRSELSRLDVRLRGYSREAVQDELSGLDYTGDDKLKKGAFLFATITAIQGKAEDLQIEVAFDKNLGTAIIDAEGLSRMVLASVRYAKNRWAKATPQDLNAFLKELKVGDRVWASVKSVGRAGAATRCALEKYPLIQGGALVLQQGRIRSVAGGSENRFLNRAIYSPRTMGSVFKPPVYTAALQLGWNSTDLLNNERCFFVYQGQPYFPRPDHQSPHSRVSMSWAGVHSENVASIWLLAHLCDKLSAPQFREVAEHVGLAPRRIDGEREPYSVYSARIRDRYGILVNRDILREAAFYQAVSTLETDFIFEDRMEEYKRLRELHYGQNFALFKEKIKGLLAKEKRSAQAQQARINEYQLRLSLLQDSYLLEQGLLPEFKVLKQQIEGLVGDPFPDLRRITPSASGCSLYVNTVSNTFSFQRRPSHQENMVPVNYPGLLSWLERMQPEGRQRFWQGVRINNNLSAATLELVRGQLEHEYEKLLKAQPYAFDTLAKIPDFRLTVGLFYLRALCQELGVNSKLEPVLSFPLGSNVVTLLEAVRLYEGLVTGEVTSFSAGTEDEGGDVLAIIDRIESADGRVLYQNTGNRKIVVDKKTRLAVGSILENIMKFGTGRRAKQIVHLPATEDAVKAEEEELLALEVPLLGKTGTANNYTNAAFIGYLPQIGADGISMTLEDGFAIGTYVGFDDNTSMRRNSSHITGAAGALPTWAAIVNVLLDGQGYSERLDPVDLSFYGLGIKRSVLGQINVGVDAGSGVVTQPLQMVDELSRGVPSIMTFGKKSLSGLLIPERSFSPFWRLGPAEKNPVQP